MHMLEIKFKRVEEDAIQTVKECYLNRVLIYLCDFSRRIVFNQECIFSRKLRYHSKEIQD